MLSQEMYDQLEPYEQGVESVARYLEQFGITLDPDAGTDTGDPADYLAHQILGYINGLHNDYEDRSAGPRAQRRGGEVVSYRLFVTSFKTIKGTPGYEVPSVEIRSDDGTVAGELTRAAVPDLAAFFRLGLTFGEHTRNGELHTEWHWECDCALHPRDGVDGPLFPHIHQCAYHEAAAQPREQAPGEVK